jgi:O-antigen ligase
MTTVPGRMPPHAATANPLVRSWILIISFSVFVAVLNVATDGNVLAVIAFFFAIPFIIFSVLRPRTSFYALLFLTLALEQFAAPYSWTYKANLPYHLNLNNISPALKGLSVTPLEIHLLCIIIGVIWNHWGKQEPWVPFLVHKPMYLYAGSIVFFIVYGVVYRGGDFFPAMWETRPIFYLFALIMIVPQIIVNEEQIRKLIWVVIAGIGVRAIELTSHYVGAGYTVLGRGWGSHEDALFQATLLILLAILLILKAEAPMQRNVLIALIIPCVLAMVAGNRRTAYPMLGASLTVIVFMMSGEFQRKMLKYAWKAAIVFALYLAVFWNSRSDSPFIAPVRSLREGFAGDDRAEAGDDSYSSNLYRKVENFNLYRMISAQPLLGNGYGVLVDYSMPLPVTWDLGFYIPHNQLLSVLAKTGIVGFCIFSLFYLSVIGEIARAFQKVYNNRYLQAVLTLAAAGVVGHLGWSFFDLVITYYRTNVYLGTMIGVSASILAIEARREKEMNAERQGPVVGAQRQSVFGLLKKHAEEEVAA